MPNLYLDIETLPTDSNQEIDYIVSKIKAPSNYKNPEVIERYIENARDDVVAKTALTGLFHRIYMIGFSIGDEPAMVVRGDTERETLTLFDDMLKASGIRNEHGDFKATVVGHNAKGFDVPRLSQRLIVNGLKPLFRFENRYPSIEDTMLMAACGAYKEYHSLEALCLAFGLPCSKGDMDGSQVAQYYREGRHLEVEKYCKGDVEDVRRVYLHMTQGAKAA